MCTNRVNYQHNSILEVFCIVPFILFHFIHYMYLSLQKAFNNHLCVIKNIVKNSFVKSNYLSSEYYNSMKMFKLVILKVYLLIDNR